MSGIARQSGAAGAKSADKLIAQRRLPLRGAPRRRAALAEELAGEAARLLAALKAASQHRAAGGVDGGDKTTDE